MSLARVANAKGFSILPVTEGFIPPITRNRPGCTIGSQTATGMGGSNSGLGGGSSNPGSGEVIVVRLIKLLSLLLN